MSSPKDPGLFPWTKNKKEYLIFLNNPMDITISSNYIANRSPQWQWGFNREVVEEYDVKFFLSEPYDQMPLYINDDHLWKRLFAWYRLTVGR